jgi:hypothetical protein
MNKAIKSQHILASRAWKLPGELRISRTTTTAATAVAVLAAISMLAAALALPSKMMADDNDARTFTVDVGFRNPFYQNNIDPAETAQNLAAFSPGDTFIQYGTIFPGGTIPEGKTDFDPDKAPGAIGVYLARGTWTTDLTNFLKAVEKERGADSDLAFATEIFSFADNRGAILTDGILPNAHFSGRRVVLGGTRGFSDVVGEVHEENIGENITTNYCNLRVTFKIRKVGEGHGR